MHQKSIDLIRLVQWIIGGLVVSVAIILLFGLVFGTAESYPPVPLSRIWTIILFFIAGIVALPMNITLASRKISNVVKVVLFAALLLLGILLI